MRDVDTCYHRVDGLCPPVCAECLVPSLSVVNRTMKSQQWGDVQGFCSAQQLYR